MKKNELITRLVNRKLTPGAARELCYVATASRKLCFTATTNRRLCYAAAK